jgi:hypothetical protein
MSMSDLHTLIRLNDDVWIYETPFYEREYDAIVCLRKGDILLCIGRSDEWTQALTHSCIGWINLDSGSFDNV